MADVTVTEETDCITEGSGSVTGKPDRRDLGPIDLVATGLRALWDGLKVTLMYLFSHSITMKYPYERRELPAGYRGLHVLKVDPKTHEMKCIGCMLCARACPDHLITIESVPGDAKKREIKVFDVDISRCMFCNLCAEACPHDAIALSKKYELATETRGGLIYHKEDLIEKPEEDLIEKPEDKS